MYTCTCLIELKLKRGLLDALFTHFLAPFSHYTGKFFVAPRKSMGYNMNPYTYPLCDFPL